MMVLVGWLVALVAVGLILGIVGFGLTGQLARLRRAVSALRSDVQPRALDLIPQLPGQTSSERPGAEHRRNDEG